MQYIIKELILNIIIYKISFLKSIAPNKQIRVNNIADLIFVSNTHGIHKKHQQEQHIY